VHGLVAAPMCGGHELRREILVDEEAGGCHSW
jgi:hypothetical protein